MEVYKRILAMALPHWRRLALSMISMLIVGCCTGAVAYLIKPVLDDVFINKNMEKLRIMPVAVLILFVVKGVCAYSNAYLMGSVGLSVVTGMRQKLYDHIQHLHLSFFDHMPTGMLMSRIVSDVNLMQASVSDTISGIIKEFLTAIILVGVIFYRDWHLALVAILVLPFAAIPIVLFGRKFRKISKKNQQSLARLTITLHESIMGIRVVKAFGMEWYESKRFYRHNMSHLKTVLRSVRVRSLSSPVMELIGGLGIVTIIWYGGYSVLQGESTPGNFFSFMAAMIMLYEPVKKLTNMNNSIQQGVAAAERVYQILDLEPEIKDRPDARVLDPGSHSIEFDNVSFRYGAETVLRQVCLKVAPGEVVALVGMSGAGKTTLVNLIPRFYEVSEGAILVNGVDIRDLTIASLRSQIGIVTQQSILFNDTVRNNIAYGDVRKGEDDIVSAAKSANAYDFIMKMPNGFDTVIGEQGVRLSGGQRQRVCIARALLKDAPILILDEATSALDSDSEQEVQRALENLMAGRTTLVIAHRLSTIKNADRIVAMSNGRIVEEGRHEDLLRGYGEYRRLYDLQFSRSQQDMDASFESCTQSRRS
ncbi:MAG: lipid A export permease/ATP-binding protein MsbA [Syntrophobacteraceae bacterium]